MSDARVSVVVATRNRRESLLRTLAHLESLPERPAVVVVDNASADGTLEAVRRAHPSVDVVALAENRSATARTLGVDRVATPYVAFSDDDSWWAPGSLGRAADLFDAHPRLALVAARVLVGEDAVEDPTCAEMARSPLVSPFPLPGPPVLGFIGCGSVVRRSAFLEVGGFDARLGIRGEEELLALDLATGGWALAYVPDVVAHHHPSDQRDQSERRRLEVRNSLWIAWLRRPGRVALRRTGAACLAALDDGEARRAVLDAFRGAGSIVRDRRVVSADVERALRQLGA